MEKIVIDEATSKLLDELAETSSRRCSRSALVRMALRQYAKRHRRSETDVKDGEVFRKYRKRLARDARVLIAEQARS
jgi:predicted transcriptional regulator